jgi:hypothetical protein
MKTIFGVVCFVTAAAASQLALGHGLPIVVDVADGNLTVSGGILDTDGFAPMVFADGDEDLQLSHENLLGFGPVAWTDVPAFNIFGMAPGSGLFLQVLARPVKDSNPLEKRQLWHWSAASQSVTADQSGESLLVASEFGQITVPQTGAPIPPPLEIVDPLPEQIGAHVDALRYLLGDDPPADVGAFGFYAKLTSPNYGASGPLLAIFNNGLDEDTLLTAALAINNAALLAGDYNHDDAVNLADFSLWKSNFGSTTQLAADGNGDGIVDAADHTIWRAHLGQQFSGAGSAAGSGHSVPEPTTSELFLPAAVVAVLLFFGVPKRTGRG